MTLAQIPLYDPDWFLSPKETVEYIFHHYHLSIKLSSFYSMTNRKKGPKPTYFCGLPKFKVSDIDEWVRNNLSDNRK